MRPKISDSKTPISVSGRSLCGIHRLLFAFSLAFAWIPALSAEEDVEPPQEIKEAIVKALDAKAVEVAKEKNEHDKPSKRGRYGKRFTKSEDGRYKAFFFIDTVLGNKVRTERFAMILAPGEGGEWKIAEETLIDSAETLERRSLGDEKFYAFDGFHFKGEGFEVTAPAGTAYVDFSRGEMDYIVFDAEGITHTYTPPDGLAFEYKGRHGLVVELHPEDFDFESERLTIFADPVFAKRFLEENFRGKREITVDELGEKLKKDYQENQRDAERAREKNPFSGFRFKRDEDRKYYWLSLKKKKRDHRITLSYDSFSAREISFRASGYGTLYSYYSEETRAKGIPPWELELREDSDSRYYEVTAVEGTVEMALVDAETMVADLTYTLKAKSKLESISFAISQTRREGEEAAIKDPLLFVNSIQDETGTELFWIKRGQNSGRIVFPTPKKPGEPFVIRMSFENRKCIYNRNASYKGVSRLGWLPFVRFGDMIHDFEVTIKVPKQFTTLGIGTKIWEKEEGEVSVTHWKASNPVVFPSIIFGEYIVEKSPIEVKKQDGTIVPVTIYVDKIGMGDWEIRKKGMRKLVDEAANSLNLFNRIYGVDYPYGKLDLVNDPLGFLYGQAPSSLVYLGSGAFRSTAFTVTTLLSDRADATSISAFNKSLVAHEIAHQWWGSLIANANGRNYWFVESLAEYSAALYMEATYGKKAYDDKVDAWREEILETGLMASVQNASTLWSNRGYRAAVYSKGPYAFHILRKTFGDQKFFRFLRMLAKNLAGHEIVTRHIQMVAEKAFGGSMDWFFDQWIRGIGMPEYRLAYQTRQTEDGRYLIEGTILQRVVAGPKEQVLEDTYYRGSVPITVEFGRDDSELFPILVEGKETIFQFKVDKKPKKIVLNAEGEILAQRIRKGKTF